MFSQVRQDLVQPTALWVGIVSIGIKDGVELDREIVFALQTECDRQFYTRMLLAKLVQLTVGQLALVDEIAERPVGEFSPIRTTGKA